MKSRILFVYLAIFASATCGHAQGVSGPYLAAQQALLANDFRAAADAYANAAQQDRGNAFFRSQLMQVRLALGQVDQAVILAQALERSNNGDNLSTLVHLVGLVEKGNYQDAAAFLETVPTKRFRFARFSRVGC